MYNIFHDTTKNKTKKSIRTLYFLLIVSRLQGSGTNKY